jgi:hypothetical protein
VRQDTESQEGVVFLFENSHQALWAETVAQELSVPVEVVPAPTSQVASCGLALKVPGAQASRLTQAFRDEGIAFTTAV